MLIKFEDGQFIYLPCNAEFSVYYNENKRGVILKTSNEIYQLTADIEEMRDDFLQSINSLFIEFFYNRIKEIVNCIDTKNYVVEIESIYEDIYNYLRNLL